MEKLRRLLRGNWRDILFGGLAALVVLGDQLSKSWIRSHLAYGEVLFDKGFFRIVHVQNTGISFGLFDRHTIFIIVAVFLEMAVILAFVWMLRKRLAAFDGLAMRIGTGLIFGGAVGNQIDRLAMRHVTDFLDFKVWPVFNVADASAVIGTIIVAVCLIFLAGKSKKKT